MAPVGQCLYIARLERWASVCQVDDVVDVLAGPCGGITTAQYALGLALLEAGFTPATFSKDPGSEALPACRPVEGMSGRDDALLRVRRAWGGF